MPLLHPIARRWSSGRSFHRLACTACARWARPKCGESRILELVRTHDTAGAYLLWIFDPTLLDYGAPVLCELTDSTASESQPLLPSPAPTPAISDSKRLWFAVAYARMLVNLSASCETVLSTYLHPHRLPQRRGRCERAAA
ncbi:hypothetical protein PLICRDRAFT_256521 [Plicaturopsis crispa FD-325 SS-3]|nr:hypothetical protein PLICRDRAFT_256521 [Plicaturopsis crispa FD-325 SS-3]